MKKIVVENDKKKFACFSNLRWCIYEAEMQQKQVLKKKMLRERIIMSEMGRNLINTCFNTSIDK